MILLTVLDIKLLRGVILNNDKRALAFVRVAVGIMSGSDLS